MKKIFLVFMTAIFILASHTYRSLSAEVQMEEKQILDKFMETAKRDNWVMANVQQTDNGASISVHYFANNQDLILYKTPERNVDLTEMSISPDAKKVGFWIKKFSSPDPLFLVDCKGGEAIKILDIFTGYGICWSPDSKKIAFVGKLNKETADKENLSSLFIIDTQSGKQETIVKNGVGYITNQCWSPDNKKLMYVVNDKIMIYDFNNKSSRLLINGNWPVYSPKGDSIVYWDLESNLNMVGIHGGKSEVLVRNEARIESESMRGMPMTPFFWLPNGQFIMYSKCLGEHCEIGTPFILDMSNKTSQQIPEENWLLSSWAESTDHF